MRFVFLISCCCFITICHCQEKSYISVLDKNTFLPIKEVFVFQNNQLTGISCKNGICEINTNSNHILFVKQDYKTTSYFDTEIIFMEPIISNNNFIAKDSNIKIIDEVSIDGRYKARNHLSKMRKNSINNFSRLDIDTLIIYYRFYANINIANTYQQEKFQGILKVSYNSFNQSLDVLNANFCQIELFENNIEDRTYERTRPNFFHQLLRRNIMVDNNKDWRHVVSRRNTIENIFNANDSTFFRSFRVQNNEETLFFYLGFAENKIKFFISDWTTDRNNSKQVPFNPYGVYRQHLMINYCNNFHILPHTLTYKESTILDGESDVEYFIKFEQIEKPKDIKIDCIFPLRVSERNEQVVERVRKNDDG